MLKNGNPGTRKDFIVPYWAYMGLDLLPKPKYFQSGEKTKKWVFLSLNIQAFL